MVVVVAGVALGFYRPLTAFPPNPPPPLLPVVLKQKGGQWAVKSRVANAGRDQDWPDERLEGIASF